MNWIGCEGRSTAPVPADEILEPRFADSGQTARADHQHIRLGNRVPGNRSHGFAGGRSHPRMKQVKASTFRLNRRNENVTCGLGGQSTGGAFPIAGTRVLVRDEEAALATFG